MANISKIQFLRSPTAGKVPAAAQLADGELALNTTDRVIYTKVGTNVIPMNDGYGKSLLIANRFSELKGQGISNLKEMLNNIEAQGTRPWPLEQFQGTGSAITALGDPRLTEGNNTITINSNAITDGPVGYGSQLSAAVMVNIRRAYNAGMTLAQILYVNGGVSFIRTSGGITTAGTWNWNGLTTGADANGWRKQFDSAVLPSLAELGAAQSGVNSDITTLNALTLVQGGDTNFNGSIYQIGATRTFQNNYRIGLIRDRFSDGHAVNPYITFVQKDVGDGDLLPTTNRLIGRVEYKVASPTADDFAGRSIGAYQVLLDPSGSGITQFYTYDTDGVGTLLDLYAANGNVNIRNKSITSLTANFGCFSIGNLTNLSSSPNKGQPLLAVHTRDTGTSAGSSTFLGHNGGTPEAPVYSHYFRGKGTTNVDTQLGLRVAKDTALLGALTVTGGTDFNGVVNFNSHDTAVTFSSSNARYPIIGINYSSAGNFGFWDRTPDANKWMLRRDTAVNTVWHLDGGLSLEYADVALSNIQIASGANDSYIKNVASNKYLQLKNDGTLAYSNQKIYHEGNKPTAADVAALPIIGGTITGALTINGTSVHGGVATFNNRIQANGTQGIMIGDTDSGFRGPADGIVQLVSNNADFITFDGRNATGAGTMKVSGTQWAAANGKGYVDQWAQSGVVNVDFGASAAGYFNAFKAVHQRAGQGYTTQIGLGIVSDGDNQWGKLSLFVGSNEAANGVKAAATLDVNGQFTANSINSIGVINAIQSVLVNAPGTGDNVHLYLRNSDGNTRAIVYAQPNNTLVFSSASGGNATLSPTGTFTTSGRLLAGGGTAAIETDGNVYGAAWGGYLSTWVNNNYAGKGAEQKAEEGRDAYNNCARWVRWGATNNFGATGGEKWVDAGWVMIGLNSTGGQQNASINIIGGRLQIYRVNGGWVDSSA